MKRKEFKRSKCKKKVVSTLYDMYTHKKDFNKLTMCILDSDNEYTSIKFSLKNCKILLNMKCAIDSLYLLE